MSLSKDIFASTDFINTNSNTNWANFDAFENATNENSSKHDVNPSNDIDDEWAEFQSNTNDHVQSSEEINTLISTCFPLESSTNMTNSTMFELPHFTTFNNQIKQMPCFQQSLSLWKHLSTISTDPMGIQHQWRRSNIEHLFHQSLNISTDTISENSNQIQENNKIECENASLNINDLVTQTNSSCSIDDNLFQVNTHSSSIRLNQNSSPTMCSSQSTPIKTMDLYPGPTKLTTEESKAIVNTKPNFTSMNPKTLMSSMQINRSD